MLKRFSVALAALFVLASSAFGAGTLPGFSLSQQMGKDGKPLAGCILKFYQAGTVATPQIAYQDSGLTIPIAGGAQATCDAFGRIGQFFLADGSIKIVLTDVHGITQVTADGLLVIGASSGGGGGSPVDPTTILATGDIKTTYGTGILTGFVRANGRTIGSATSGATERANADTSALFLYLWGADANLAVSGGRGASAAADYAANKTIAVPDYRGRALAGLDDMGNTAAGRLTSTYFGAAATTLGIAGGSQSHSLSAVELAAHNHGVFLSDPGHAHSAVTGFFVLSSPNNSVFGPGSNGAFNSGSASATTGITVRDAAGGAGTANQTASTGSGTAFSVLPPMMLITVYLKL